MWWHEHRPPPQIDINISVLQRRKLRFSDLTYLTQVQRVSLSPLTPKPMASCTHQHRNSHILTDLVWSDLKGNVHTESKGTGMEL